MEKPGITKSALVLGLAIAFLIPVHWLGHLAGTAHSDINTYNLLLSRISDRPVFVSDIFEEAQFTPGQLLQVVAAEVRYRQETAPHLKEATNEMVALAGYLSQPEADPDIADNQRKKILALVDRMIEARINRWYDIRDDLRPDQQQLIQRITVRIFEEADLTPGMRQPLMMRE